MEDRRRGIILLTEEDILKMLNLPEGYGVLGVSAAFMRVGIKVMVGGPDLPEHVPGTEVSYISVDKTFIIHNDQVVGLRLEPFNSDRHVLPTVRVEQLTKVVEED